MRFAAQRSPDPPDTPAPVHPGLASVQLSSTQLDVDRLLDPAAAEDEVVLVDGDDLAGRDGGLGVVEPDASPSPGRGSTVAGTARCWARIWARQATGLSGIGPLPVEPRGVRPTFSSDSRRPTVTVRVSGSIWTT